ncbi:uncharacterized protein LOC125231608 [Leguminivora glycinivorella]|uniref:uncharacterized protein LOC125231608 n=1 Tax=Leguminivora glycinivorella TaxID=1035111 RepID=UPI00200E5D2D|nr:uncharacterized protein LOC125231608 [Leguminivora glycinivorella]
MWQVHSIFHVPHLLLYRRLGILTAFWSFVSVLLIIGAITEEEILYEVWIWYSSVYVPVMLIIMCIVMTASIWAMELKMMRAVAATVAVVFYLFMFYSIIFVQAEKRKIFSTTTPTTTTTTPCPWCPTCTTPKCTTPKKKKLLRTVELMLLHSSETTSTEKNTLSHELIVEEEITTKKTIRMLELMLLDRLR